MILIITKDSDRAVERIIDWLNAKGASYYKGSIEEIFLMCDLTIKQNNEQLDLYLNGEKVKSMFFRHFTYLDILLAEIVKNSELNKFLGREAATVLSSFREIFSFKAFPYFDKIRNNKIYELTIAKNVGIDVPPFLITNSKSDLLEFKSQQGKIISKALSNGAKTSFNGETIFAYVDIVSQEMIDKVESTFFISYFQKYIEKEYELRVFFIDGAFYSMAIMSQESAQTSIDFRRYNVEKWNRNIPYELNSTLQNNLKDLMQKLELSTGSIDIIKSTDGKYYFLEVNPIGQFGMTSEPCNYNLDKVIAETLIKYDNK